MKWCARWCRPRTLAGLRGGSAIGQNVKYRRGTVSTPSTPKPLTGLCSVYPASDRQSGGAGPNKNTQPEPPSLPAPTGCVYVFLDSEVQIYFLMYLWTTSKEGQPTTCAAKLGWWLSFFLYAMIKSFCPLKLIEHWKVIDSEKPCQAYTRHTLLLSPPPNTHPLIPPLLQATIL